MIMSYLTDELRNIFSGGGVRLKKVGPPKVGEEKKLPFQPGQPQPIPALKPPSKVIITCKQPLIYNDILAPEP
jgi:hypothetical protein